MDGNALEVLSPALFSNLSQLVQLYVPCPFFVLCDLMVDSLFASALIIRNLEKNAISAIASSAFRAVTRIVRMYVAFDAQSSFAVT